MSLVFLGWLLVAGGATIVLADMVSDERRGAFRGWLGRRIQVLRSPAAVLRVLGSMLAKDARQARSSTEDEPALESGEKVGFRDYLLLLNPYSGSGRSLFFLAVIFAGTLFSLSLIIAWLFEQNFFIANRTSVFYASLIFSVLILVLGLLMRFVRAGRPLSRVLSAAFVASLVLNPLVLAVGLALLIVALVVLVVCPWIVAGALGAVWLVLAAVGKARGGSLKHLGPRAVALGLIALGLILQLLGGG